LEIVTLSATVTTNTRAAIFASCPTGKKILGGGYSGLTLDLMRVERNGPGLTLGGGFSTASWEVEVFNDNDNFAATVTAYAICATAP